MTAGGGYGVVVHGGDLATVVDLVVLGLGTGSRRVQADWPGPNRSLRRRG